ncbi:PH domain-containing protein [uncultured Lacinutrix sp.]|uniref:PH domain-containing protein n=1 Tax=uncultured Lacinutrix sp. TaxID=574032 RepID=UPI0026289F2C|nr:PH domain-containing protein [uncultured Lacinutrix sp.]
MSDFNFIEPSRQSTRGIAVLFGVNAYKFIKKLFILILTFSYAIIKKGEVFGLSLTKMLLIVFTIIVLIVLRSILQYLNFKFHIVGEDFMLSKGILNKEKITVSKSKIQNIYIKQNILQQIINVVQLDIETAGDANAEVNITALSRAKALALKEELLSHINQTEKNINKSAIDENNIYYKASVKKLLLEGFSQNHGRSFLLIAGFFGGLYSSYNDLLGELKIGDKIDDFMIENQDSIGFLILLFFGIFIFTLLFSVIFSLINTFLLNYNLQVIEHKKTIEIQKGLLNKVAIHLSPSRIQNIVISNNRLKRYFGLNTLVIKQAMVDKRLLKHFSIVGLGKEQVTYLTKKLIKKFKVISKKEKPEKYYIRILIYKSFLSIIFFNTISYFVLENYFLLINIILLPVISILIHWRYKKAYYSINDEILLVGSGSVSTITQLLEIHKIQAVATKQSIFQKIRKITTVKVFTASKETTILYIKEDKANTIINFLLFQIESGRKDWM